MSRERSSNSGYTIVEIMIFLAVSGLLAATTLSMVSGRQNNAEFNQSVREMDATIRDVINDVSTGYYPNSDKVKCQKGAIVGDPVILAEFPGTKQGTNSECVNIGKVIQFAPLGTNNTGIRVHTIAGHRLKPGATSEVASVIEAKGKVIAKGTVAADSTVPDDYEDYSFGGSINISNVRYTYTGPAPTTRDTAAIGLFTTFSSYSGSFLSTGSSNTNLIPIASNTAAPAYTFTLNLSTGLFVDYLNRQLQKKNPTAPTPDITATTNPTNVEICVLSMVSKQKARITIGGSGRKLTTNVDIKNGIACYPGGIW